MINNYLLPAVFAACVSLLSISNTAANETLRQFVEGTSVSGINANFQPKCLVSTRTVYTQNAFQPVWGDTSKQNALLRSINKSASHGLNPADYHLSDLKQLRQRPSPQNTAALDFLLTDAWFLLSNHMANGKVNPMTGDVNWFIAENRTDFIRDFNQAIASNDPGKAALAYAPSHADYQALLKSYSGLPAPSTSPTVLLAFEQKIKPGEKSERVRTIAQRLSELEYLDPKQVSDQYEGPMKTAVESFQKQHNLNTDGIIGEATLWYLNLSPDRKRELIAINLERWRWLPRERENRYLEVNLTTFRLKAKEGGETTFSEAVIVGKTTRQTPVFKGEMRYYVLNPTWTVPPGILKNDVIPAVRKNTGYLAGKNIKVLDASGKVLDPTAIDWSSKTVYSYTYRQDPGPTNALGGIKFMFPNSHNIYIHDTPTKELFSNTERAFSSGCIRLKNPLDLAVYIMDGKGLSKPQLEQKIKDGKTETVMLQRTLPVYILYLTARENEGLLQYHFDLYGRDERIAQLLKQ